MVILTTNNVYRDFSGKVKVAGIKMSVYPSYGIAIRNDDIEMDVSCLSSHL